MNIRHARARGVVAAVVVAAAVIIGVVVVIDTAAAQGQQPAAPSTILQQPSNPHQPMAPPQQAGPPITSQPGVLGQPSVPDEDIRDIRGPKYLLPLWLIPAIVAGVVVLALLGYAIWRWARRARTPRVLTSSEAALQRLEEIRALMQPATAREFSIEVSDVVRRYIERGFDLTATHRTTEEFLHDLLETTHPALIGHRDLLAGFLEQCDLAKFAGMSLSAQSMEALRASARTFVIESSKPVPAAPPVGVKPTSQPKAGTAASAQ